MGKSSRDINFSTRFKIINFFRLVSSYIRNHSQLKKIVSFPNHCVLLPNVTHH
jgi:hypothetical protein